MDVKKNDYDAAQALLDLQGDNMMKLENPETHVWRGNDSREDMEKAAKLFWNCFISSEVPITPNTNLINTNPNKTGLQYQTIPKVFDGYSNNVPAFISKGSNPTFYKNCDQKLDGHNNVKPAQILSHFDNIKKNVQNLQKNIIKRRTCPMAKVNTCEVGTQTEERYFNPNIELMETTIQSLYERIKSLEAQLKQSNVSTEQSGLVSSENEDNNYTNEGISDETNNDYDMDVSEERVNESNASLYSEHSHKVQYDRSDYRRCRTSHSRNNSYQDRVLVNHNFYTNSNDLVPIGDGHATVPSRILKHINWNSYTSATRKLLTAVFSRRVLATHSLTGKPSPAFPNKPAKKKLDTALVNDIVQTVVERCSVPENVVRTSITTKCADESKMFRTRQRNTKKRVSKKDRENVPPVTSDSEPENY